MKQAIHIRVDGNAQIGHGHYVRCIALAQMLNHRFECHFYSLTFPDGMPIVLEQEGCLLHHLLHESDFLKILSSGDLVVIDGYGFDRSYQQLVKQTGAVLCVIDDAPTGDYWSDCLINHAPGNEATQLHLAPNGIHALGTDYALLRKQYQLKAKQQLTSGDLQTVLVCFGGSDPKQLTVSTLQVLLELGTFQRINVVLGASFQAVELVQELAVKHPEITVHISVTETEMIALMEAGRFAIVPCSGMLLEAIALSRTIISGYYVANQQQFYTQFRSLNCFLDAADFSRPALQKALGELSHNSTKTTGIIDGFAPSRIRNLFGRLLHPEEVYLTEAVPEDELTTFKWASDPAVRFFSFSDKPIVWEEHQAWFQRKIRSNDCQYYIARMGTKAVGSIRFDQVDDAAVISYLLDPAFHGKGLGTWLLKAGMEQLFVDLPFSFREITGSVINSNIPSLKSFEKLNFEKTETEGIVTFRRMI